MDEDERALGVRLFGGRRGTTPNTVYRNGVAENEGWVARFNPQPPPQPDTILVWRPWCVLPSTFGGLSQDEKKERQLHKEHKCSGRDFVQEAAERYRRHWRSSGETADSYMRAWRTNIFETVEPMDID